MLSAVGLCYLPDVVTAASYALVRKQMVAPRSTYYTVWDEILAGFLPSGSVSSDIFVRKLILFVHVTLRFIQDLFKYILHESVNNLLSLQREISDYTHADNVFWQMFF